MIQVREHEGMEGTISTGSINLEEEGPVSEVTEEAEAEAEIADAKVNGRKLSFRSKEGSGATDEYEMTLVRPGEAELRMLDAPGIIQPFVLKRK